MTSNVEKGSANCRDNNKELDSLLGVLSNPEKMILPLLYSTTRIKQNHNDQENGYGEESDQGKKIMLTKLLDVSKHLFADIESLANQYQKLHEKVKMSSLSDKDKDTTNTMISSTSISNILSGLLELHVPQEVEPTDSDLPETIFGQVDLQTTALAKLVKKSTKRLIKTDSKNFNIGEISILNMGVLDSDSDEGDKNDGSEGENDDQNLDDEFDTNSNSNTGDEEEQRIRLRMERALEDMGEEDTESSDHEDGKTEHIRNEKKQVILESNEELFDPVAEDLKDGFFDLIEMEEFADEEEDYLPSEAFGQPADGDSTIAKQSTNVKSFHQKQREGYIANSDSEDSDEGNFDQMYEEVKDFKRKKYRHQEDIDALYNLYQEANDGVDSDDDVINMTAADYFGEPKKKYIALYKKNHPVTQEFAGMAPTDDDEDSWGEYDFEQENQKGWRDDHTDDVEDEEDKIEDMKPSVDVVQKEDGYVESTKTELNNDKKLRNQTDELEMELINEKPWQMRGESKSTSRPINSLLEGTPEFEMASKQAPMITVEHTIDLEEVIKKRILAEDWDDVIPRELPDIGWNKKRGETPEVSQEKSKLGLGELYEREYLKRAVGFDKDAVEKQTEEDKAKEEMKELFANLCSKLDALSNYHFAPRPITDEAEARPVTVPAIAMEEVLPLHVSDARGVAPEEVFATKRGREGVLRADTEMDQNDRKRQRQSKKAARRKARKEKEADEKLISRLQPGLGLNNPYEKRKAREELSLARARGNVTAGEKDIDSKFGSSGTFFKRLQAEAQNAILDRVSGTDNNLEKRTKPRSSAFKL